MPGKKHLPGATPKQNRMYEHIKASEISSGMPTKEAKSVAAATVNKYKSSKK